MITIIGLQLIKLWRRTTRRRMATNEYIFATTTVKRMKETHIQTNSSICFISIPSFWINIWINSFRPILMAVRTIIIILGPGNHFAPPPPPTTIHCPLGYPGQARTIHRACTLKTANFCLSIRCWREVIGRI